MKITRASDIPSINAPADYFTGRVRTDGRHEPEQPARAGAAIVTFEPGARTAWHTHPLGQLLIVTAGEGWARTENGPREVIRPGDMVWIPPGERHWHGATATKAMTHVAIHESLDGRHVDWQEHVSDADYLG